jgi:hypothetical protein
MVVMTPGTGKARGLVDFEKNDDKLWVDRLAAFLCERG